MGVFNISPFYQYFKVMQFLMQKLFESRVQESGDTGSQASHYRMIAKHHPDQSPRTIDIIIKLHFASIFNDCSFFGTPSNQLARYILYNFSFPSNCSMVTRQNSPPSRLGLA